MLYFVHIYSNVKFYADFCNCIHIFLRFLIYNLPLFFSKLVKALLRFRICVILGVLTIFMGKSEILVGKSNSSHHSVWEALDCKTVGFFLKISKEIGKAWRKSLTRAKRASLTRPSGVSPQSRSLFSASSQAFCLTARAYLNTQKYGLFCSLRVWSRAQQIKSRHRLNFDTNELHWLTYKFCLLKCRNKLSEVFFSVFKNIARPRKEKR